MADRVVLLYLTEAALHNSPTLGNNTKHTKLNNWAALNSSSFSFDTIKYTTFPTMYDVYKKIYSVIP